MTKAFLFSILVALAATVGVMVAFHPKVQSLQELQASTVSINMGTEGTCSGWVLKGSHKVVTAAHCMPSDPKVPITVDFHDGTGIHSFTVDKVGEPEGTKPDLMTLVPADKSVVKWPEGLSICGFPAYYMESVLLFGDPLGFQQVITAGRVAQPAQKLPTIRDLPYIQYDGSLSPGDSGGPAVDVKEQCVIGSADGILNSYAGDGLKFLEPAARLKEIL